MPELPPAGKQEAQGKKLYISMIYMNFVFRGVGKKAKPLKNNKTDFLRKLHI